MAPEARLDELGIELPAPRERPPISCAAHFEKSSARSIVSSAGSRCSSSCAPPGFGDQPAVANGFTDAVVELWGEDRGLCARCAIGVAELPNGLAVEVEALVAVV